MNLRFATVFVFSLLTAESLSRVASAAAPATQPGTATEPSELQTKTLVYDVRDLIAQGLTSPAPDGAAPEQKQPALFPQPPQPPMDIAGQLRRLLQNTIAAETWKDNGGSIGNMSEFSGMLVVTQTDANHGAVAQLLNNLRAQKGPSEMIVLRAYWVMLDPQSVPGMQEVLPVVDEKLLDPKNLYCQAQSSGFAGQRLAIASGHRRTIVTQLSPIVGTNAIGYQPQTERSRTGVTLDARVQLLPGNSNEGIVELHSTMAESLPTEEKISAPSAAATKVADVAQIDRVAELSQELHTTIRIPMGKKVLVGGMTLDPNSRSASGKQLYLIVEAHAL